MSSKTAKLFELIKNHQYAQFISIIKLDQTLDLNEVDDSGVYLIQYAIIFRQIDIVSLLISRNCKLDILNSDGRNIFYVPIKFGYIDIVRLLINFSNITIGIPLLELQDRNMNIPLHYAIIFYKYDIINEILNANSNINYKDIDGNTALHLMIKYTKPENQKNSIDIIKQLFKKKIGINYTNNIGQNALHIAVENNNIDIIDLLLKNNINYNTETVNDHLTPILIATMQNNINICKLLLKYPINYNNQDLYGNTILNYTIANKSKELIDLYYNIVDVNLINISGQIAINFYFDNNYKYDTNYLNEYKFNEILLKSDMNVQNNEGKTIWYYLIEHDIWESYSDIIINKINKVHIQDNNNISPYELIKTKYPSKLNKFVDLIANSFYNNIISNKPDLSHIKELKNFSNNSNSENIKIIKSLIINKYISSPENSKSYCLIINDYDHTTFSTYIGISLDIVMGLIYIKNTFKNIDTSLTTNFINNEILEDFYISNGNEKYKNDFLNFEINWYYHRLFFPNNLKDIISNFLKDDSKRYLIIPLGIGLSNGAHANIIIYDKQNNEIERFEPYGSKYPPGFNYNPVNLDISIKKLLSNYFNNELKYYAPNDYEPKIGFQYLDSTTYEKEKNIGDPGGFCAAWSLWYVEMRLINPDINRDDLINKLINTIRSKNISFRTIIRNFSKNVVDIRDKLLNDAGLDINKWYNNNYTNDEWDKLIELIKKKI